MSTFNFQLSTFKRFFDSNALWLSMIIGVLGYKCFRYGAPLLPSMIFLMLFFTFCKIDPKDLRLHRWHWAVLAVQISLAVATYYAVFALTRDQIVAQGLMMCFIMPTATAAPIIAGKLGGSIQNLTTFTLLSNFATSLIVPAFFPLINPELATVPASFQFSPFIYHFTLLLRRISPLLLGPFFAAWLLRIGVNAYYRHIDMSSSRHDEKTALREFSLPSSLAQVPFYLWVGTIIILMASMTDTLLSTFNFQLSTLLWLLIGSFLSCLLQFFIGKWIGRRMPAPSRGKDYEDVLLNPNAPRDMPSVSSVTAGQAFGQKNTTLGVWMAQTFLNPLSAIGATAYIIWQNFFNSAQLYRAAHGKSI